MAKKVAKKDIKKLKKEAKMKPSVNRTTKRTNQESPSKKPLTKSKNNLVEKAKPKKAISEKKTSKTDTSKHKQKLAIKTGNKSPVKKDLAKQKTQAEPKTKTISSKLQKPTINKILNIEKKTEKIPAKKESLFPGLNLLKKKIEPTIEASSEEKSEPKVLEEKNTAAPSIDKKTEKNKKDSDKRSEKQNPLKESKTSPDNLTDKINDISAEHLSDEGKLWLAQKIKHGKNTCPTYNMSEQYPAQSPLIHKTLGWGFILSNNNDRLEVLFETGKKILISNYKTK